MTDAFRTALVAAAARSTAAPARRPRPRVRTLALAGGALAATAAAAGAATGTFALPDGSRGEVVTLTCTANADGTVTLALPFAAEGLPGTLALPTRDASRPGRCPTAPGARIVANADGALPRVTRVIGAASPTAATFEVLGLDVSGDEVVIASLDRDHLGKTAAQIGLEPDAEPAPDDAASSSERPQEPGATRPAEPAALARAPLVCRSGTARARDHVAQKVPGTS